MVLADFFLLDNPWHILSVCLAGYLMGAIYLRKYWYPTGTMHLIIVGVAFFTWIYTLRVFEETPLAGQYAGIIPLWILFITFGVLGAKNRKRK